MFLKRLKLNSVQKSFNRLLNDVAHNYSEKKIHTIGILMHHDEFHNYDALEKALKVMGFNQNQLTFLTFTAAEITSVNSWDNTFSQEDFGWKAKILNLEVQQFIDTEFDALISYYNGDFLELNLVTLLSKAKFKIGLNNHQPKLYQLMFAIDVKHVQVFQKELEMYLTTLNKL